jgi:hypothetical protein
MNSACCLSIELRRRRCTSSDRCSDLHKEILLPGGGTDADHQFHGPVEYAEAGGPTLETDHSPYAELVPKVKCMFARFLPTYYTRLPKSTDYTGSTLSELRSQCHISDRLGLEKCG